MKESLYKMLPIPLQHIACSSIGKINNIKRYGKHFNNYLDLYLKSQWWSKEKLFKYRDRRLKEFIQFSYMYIPYYQRQFKQLGINPDMIQSIADISKYLPILTKNEVKQNYDDFLAPNLSRAKVTYLHTSGTTGSGFRFPTTLKALKEQHAIYWRGRIESGANMQMLHGSFSGRLVVPLSQRKPPFWRYNYFGNQILFSGYHINKENVKYYIEELNRKKVKWIHGYPSMLSLIASYMLEDSIKLDYGIELITLGSENLSSYQLQQIKEAFGVIPKQTYGTTEATGGAFECQYGNLHIDEEFVAMEFLPIGDNQYKIIGTNFSNYAIPLLRYDTNDIATIVDKRCECGRNSRIIKAIDGREEDYIKLYDGTKIGRLDHIFKDMIGVREAQIRQKVKGEIEVRIVKTSLFSTKQERLLKNNIKNYLGDIKFKILCVEKIPRTKSGKLRFVISEESIGGSFYKNFK